ncbi:hypothetical protein CesoFtcFv8_019278 [Champsocephalus esox]|uniref:Uncharacterized protein n=1 Tax=Champsocephalus esox TaxID=159716 RepID=A0AAN8BIF1_9TELE|nr:hypothetical protein CesoFtcFv8_019278 [Champsocephalus esox]
MHHPLTPPALNHPAPACILLTLPSLPLGLTYPCIALPALPEVLCCRACPPPAAHPPPARPCTLPAAACWLTDLAMLTPPLPRADSPPPPATSAWPRLPPPCLLPPPHATCHPVRAPTLTPHSCPDLDPCPWAWPLWTTLTLPPPLAGTLLS